MTYSQKANLNATNSEMDSKTILTKELTDSQRDELTAQFVEIVVDGMDLDSLVQYAQEQMANYFNEGSLDDLKEDIDDYDEDLYDELVDNVTQQYAKVPNTFGKETFIDTNNTGGKF